MILLVMAMGNLWVFLNPSLPVSVCTHTHAQWVQIFTGLALGMDMGMDLKKKKVWAILDTIQ